MNILNLKNDNLKIVNAVPFETVKGKKYYNIKLGSFKKPFVGTSIYLDAKDFPVVSDEPLPLTENNYRILPIINKQLKLKKDKTGNPIISIKKDTDLNNKNDLMLIIDIPYDKCEFLEINTYQNVEKIMEVKNGYLWFNKTYTSPVFVYLIYGDGKIVYKYKQFDNKIVEVVFTKNNEDLNVKRTVND